MANPGKPLSKALFPKELAAAASPNLPDLQQTMLDATPDCIKVVSVDGRLLTMNKAGCRALAVPEDSEFGMPWAPLLPPDVHEAAYEALAIAASGHNVRFPGKSQSADALMYWDNLLTPLIDQAGRVLSILCVSRDITKQTELEEQLEQSAERERLLAREMQHRIKNLFSVVLGLVMLAEQDAASDGETASLGDILRNKFMALSRASDAAFGDIDNLEATEGKIELERVVSSVLLPYANRCVVRIGHVRMDRSKVTAIALLLHEFATNSIKYGALSKAAGHVVLVGETGRDALQLVWEEIGGPKRAGSATRQGFGGDMVDHLVEAAHGSIRKTWTSNGLTVEINLPSSSYS